MIKREDDGLWIVFEERVGLHHEEVFASLTTAAGLVRWFPLAAEIEARPGGKLVLGWDEKFQHKTTVAVLDYDPGGRVVWDWYASSQDRHAPVYWTVRPDVEQGSIVEFRQGPFFNDEESLIALADEAVSWRWRLCNLRTSLEARHDMRLVRPL
jgi:uncharacterized protein YndB with AHSA1/START domain